MSSKVKIEDDSGKENIIICPVCSKVFEKSVIEEHVNKCLFLNTKNENNVKRKISHLSSPSEKRSKICNNATLKLKETTPTESTMSTSTNKDSKGLPFAESLRPIKLNDIIGHKKIFGTGTMLHSLLEQKKIPNMILWGPPGCGKTSLANVISNICKEQNNNMRFVKMSATMSGVNDVKEVVKVAKNEMQFKRQTVLFMDEIHRFNKLQQDIFLPHVEGGSITLIGATTENPSFSLNNALLSRCRVIVMEKLSVDDIIIILKRAIEMSKQAVISNNEYDVNNITSLENVPKYIVEEQSLKWLAEVSDGDARIALGALELLLTARKPGFDPHTAAPTIITLDDIKESIKRSHMLYDRKSEEHYNTISAIQKSIRASDDNAALYWTVRAMHAGEDPLYLARRLIRTACEDIGLADQNALVEAVACLQGCQHIGMPEADVLLAQCAVRLARAPKSQEVYKAMKRCQRSLSEAKGPLPPVPLHLRNAPTKLMKELGYGIGYNTLHKDISNLHYMPSGMEDIDFFRSPETDIVD